MVPLPPHSLSGGLDPAFEYFRAQRPTDGDFRDSATLWAIDREGVLALPRVTIDAIGDSWETPWLQLNFVHADGRVLRIWSQEPGHIAAPRGEGAAVRTVGGLQFECIEPFGHWKLTFDGIAWQSTTDKERAGVRERVQVPLAFTLDARMVAAPWVMGAMNSDAAAAMRSGGASALMGGVRYEQLCRVEGRVRFDGQDHMLSGIGMRVRRQGVRQMVPNLDHCQHSALFPSGRGFGANILSPGPEGPPAFSEAFLLLADGRKIPARIVEAPWMTHLDDRNGTLVFDSELGRVRIEGETLLSLYDHYNFEVAGTSVLHQGTARYIWDGEETIGLIERCTARSRLSAEGG